MGIQAFDAPILSDSITVNSIGVVIDCDVIKSTYYEFLFDNIGDNQAQIELGGTIIKLEKSKFIIIRQTDVESVKIKSNDGTQIFYVFQGARKIT